MNRSFWADLAPRTWQKGEVSSRWGASIQGTPFIYCFQLSTDTMTQYCTFRRDERGTFLSRWIPVNSAQPPSPQTPPLLENARLRVFPPTITLPHAFRANGGKSCPLQTLPCPKCKTEGFLPTMTPLSRFEQPVTPPSLETQDGGFSRPPLPPPTLVLSGGGVPHPPVTFNARCLYSNQPHHPPTWDSSDRWLHTTPSLKTRVRGLLLSNTRPPFLIETCNRTRGITLPRIETLLFWRNEGDIPSCHVRFPFPSAKRVKDIVKFN